MSRIERLFVGLMFCAAGCAPTSPIDPGTTDTGPPDVGHLVDTAAPQGDGQPCQRPRAGLPLRSCSGSPASSCQSQRAPTKNAPLVAKAALSPGALAQHRATGTGPYAKQAVPKAWKP